MALLPYNAFLLTTSLEILFCIYDFLDAKPLKIVTVYQPEKVEECCVSCKEQNKKRKKRPWSPRILTQLSTKHTIAWGYLYYERTIHRICVPQLNDYMVTYFWGGEKEVPSSRRGPPVHSALVSITAETIARISLHVFHENEAQFVQFGSQLAFQIPRNGWGKHDEDKRRRKHWESTFMKLNRLYAKGFMKQLVPGAQGAGKMKELFLDRDMNIRLHPTPEYLSSYPALDSDIRHTLYELWSSIDVGAIHLLVLPLGDEEKGIQEDKKHCKLTHPFWQRSPHKSHIHSVRRFDFDKSNYKSGYSFIVRPSRYVLPEGYDLNDIGVNEQKLHAAGGAAVYMQLVSPEDDEFHIRLEGPGEYFYDKVDEDFTLPIVETDVIMKDVMEDAASSVGDNEDDDNESGDDSDLALDHMCLDYEDEDETMIPLLKEDMKVPLEVLMKTHNRMIQQAQNPLEPPALEPLPTPHGSP